LKRHGRNRHPTPTLVVQVANGSYMKPIAPYVLTYEEKKTILQIIKQLKTPTHYASALHKKVARDGKLKGLMSRDYTF